MGDGEGHRRRRLGLTKTAPGSDVSVALRIGDVATVLTHVIRRYHYEIDTLENSEVIGSAAAVPAPLGGQPRVGHGGRHPAGLVPGGREGRLLPAPDGHHP
ncbi:hypothetical protein [Actinomadura sp. GTD37]|uniref:hypothetical protein n=1 Tax=Actinomadura sp. GTD37 TaxID=1778030 RepID=UPI0035C0BB2B